MLSSTHGFLRNKPSTYALRLEGAGPCRSCRTFHTKSATRETSASTSGRMPAIKTLLDSPTLNPAPSDEPIHWQQSVPGRLVDVHQHGVHTSSNPTECGCLTESQTLLCVGNRHSNGLDLLRKKRKNLIQVIDKHHIQRARLEGFSKGCPPLKKNRIREVGGASHGSLLAHSVASTRPKNLTRRELFYRPLRKAAADLFHLVLYQVSQLL